MPTKQIKIFTEDEEQSVTITSSYENNSLMVYATEEGDKTKSFKLYVSIEEALCIGKELIKYAEELKSSDNI